MTGLINTINYIKLEAPTGLNDITISIVDVNSVVVSSGSMVEILTGVYQYQFTTPNSGNYTIQISSSSIERTTFTDLQISGIPEVDLISVGGDSVDVNSLKNTESEIHDFLDTYTNKDDWRSDISNLSLEASVDLARTLLQDIKSKQDIVCSEVSIILDRNP